MVIKIKTLIFILILVSILPITGHALTESDCYNLTPPFPTLPNNFKLKRGLRGCKTWNCFVKRAKSSRNRFTIILAKKAKTSRGNWGNYGWAKQNVCVIDTLDKLESCFLLGKGVESSELGTVSKETLEFIINDHWNFVAEQNCLREIPIKIKSFNEIQIIP